MSTVAEKMQALRKRSPHALELAMYAALASQIEPELVRALRLEFVPDADAGCEADVWFSALVQSAEPAGIVFSAEAVSELRAAFLQEYAPNLKNAFKVIERIHANGPSALKVEEKLTYYALSDEADKQQKIQHELKTILAAMADSSRSKHLARWAVRALPRLPEDAQKNSAASVLAVGASGLLNGRPIAAGASAQGTSDEWRVLTKILAQNIPYQNIYARLTRQGVEVSAEPFAGGQLVSVPRTDPLQLQVEWTQDGSPVSKSITFASNELGACETTANEITLRTILGDWYTLRLEKYDVFISYVSADQEWVESVLVPPLMQAGLRVIAPNDFASGVSQILSYERALKASKRVVVVVSRAYLENDSTGFLTELVFTPYTQTPDLLPIPLLRDDIELPGRLKALQAVDMRDPARFDGAMQILLQALGVTTIETVEQKTPTPEQDTRAVSGYLNFDLEFSRLGERRYIVNISSPRGTAQNEFEMPFRDEEIENFWQNIVRPPRKGDTRENAAREFGGRLFEAVFAGQVRGFFFNSLASTRNQNMGLRIRIDTANVPEFANLPWEALYDASTEHFFALSNATPIVRFVNLSISTPPLRVVVPPLRMLVLIAEPNPSIPIDTQREWINLQHALQEIVEEVRLEVERVEPSTLDQLRRTLRQNEYHILHLVGEADSEGTILFPSADGRLNAVNSDLLVKILGDHRSLRLVWLQTHHFETILTQSFEKLERALVQHGIPVVFARKFPMSDAANVTFVRELYSALANNLPIDIAVTNARRAIQIQGNQVEWASPALYTRLPDGVLFDIQAPPQVQHEQVRPVAEPPRAESFALRGRHINVTFEPPEQKDSPLQVSEIYTLVFGIETEQPQEIIAAVSSENALLYPSNLEQVILTVQLLGDDFEILSEPQKIIVPRVGKSKNRARFDFSPKRNGVGVLNAFFLLEGNVIQAVALRLNVGVGQSAMDTGVTAGQTLYDLASLTPRALSLWVEYVGEGFRLNLLQANKSISAFLPLTFTELERIVADARRALAEIVNFSERGRLPYQQEIEIPARTNQITLANMAQAGHRLYRAIFQHPKMNTEGQRIAELLQEIAEGESAYIQIISREMYLPWHILYISEEFESAQVEPERLLGMKHIIEHVTLRPDMEFSREIRAAPQLAVSLNLNSDLDRQLRFPFVQNQINAWNKRREQGNINLITRTRSRELIAALSELGMPDQIMYFYCNALVKNVAEGGADASLLQFAPGDSVTIQDLRLFAPINIPLKTHPLVFINANESVELAAQFYNGLMPYLIAKGARGMIGVEATVPALFAADYAEKFFDQFLAGKPLGQLMLDLRREYFFKHNNVLGLLYGLYADADTRIVWKQESAKDNIR